MIRRARKGAPWGFLGMVALVVATEGTLVRRNVATMDNMGASWSYAGQLVRHAAPGQPVLCFGDSMVMFGVLPRVINHQAKLRGHNFAVHGGTAPASYVLLRRALEAGARPSAIIVDFTAGSLSEGPASRSRPSPWAELLTVRESAELALSARDPDLFARTLVGQVVASYRRRFPIRSAILAALQGRRSAQQQVTQALLRNWRFNAGAQVNADNPDFRDVGPTPEDAAHRGSWSCHPVNAAYTRKFLELAARHGLTVYWLLPPNSRGSLARREARGLEQPYEDYVRRESGRFRNVVVVDGRRSGYPSEAFWDAIHLQRAGAVALSLGMADVLRRVPPGERQGPRWVALPPYSGRRSTAPVEDWIESLVSLRDLDLVRRR